GVVAGWNDWQKSLYYITKPELYTIQYQMQIYLNHATEIQKLVSENPSFKGSIESIPVETLRYAMAVIATIPVLLIFPSMQKYFSKGIAVGSVKG
ncbi:MAG: carbohydrate ABC transporter permease, partial [Clostridia bacterium]|nr:carbohydrate ABC transporter permease [Clostridia bacterium]